MLFTGSNNFKKNYLVVYVSTYANQLYKDCEYEIYDEVNHLRQEKGAVSDEDVSTAIRHFRELICDRMLEFVGKEYKDFELNAEEFLANVREKNFGNINEVGPTIDLVYSIVTKMVLGEDYEFRMIPASEENPDNLESPELIEMIGVMIARLEKAEEMAIGTSLELLKEDGFVK